MMFKMRGNNIFLPLPSRGFSAILYLK